MSVNRQRQFVANNLPVAGFVFRASDLSALSDQERDRRFVVLPYNMSSYIFHRRFNCNPACNNTFVQVTSPDNSLMDSDDKQFFIYYEEDCFDPPLYVFRGDMSDTYEMFTEYLDKTYPNRYDDFDDLYDDGSPGKSIELANENIQCFEVVLESILLTLPEFVESSSIPYHE